MKKYLIVLLVAVLLVGSYFGYRYYKSAKEKKTEVAVQKYEDEQIQLLQLLGNGTIQITDPHYQRPASITFQNKVADMTVSGEQVKYQIIDALQAYNLDNDVEMEYPFLISAAYPKKSTSYLIIAHFDGKLLTTVDLAEVGDPSKVEDIHRQDNEILIDANVVNDQGKTDQVILSYKLVNNKIVPDPNNVDLNKVVPVAKAQPATTPKTKQTSNGSGGKVALTFDDGPGTYTPQILAVLKNYGVKATFFEIGENAAAHPDYVKQIIDEGHVIGDHTYTHPDLTKLSYDAQLNEISKTKTAIEGIVSTNVHFFRPPYGSYNADTDKVMGALSMERILWNVDPRDWSGMPADSILQNVLANTKSGSIVLMHDGVANSKETAKALPQIIDGLRAKGFNLVTMPELKS
jgi:peptidoglycan/xylan/chitin deacetylase (PgdA/CDA1 family)